MSSRGACVVKLLLVAGRLDAGKATDAVHTVYTYSMFLVNSTRVLMYRQSMCIHLLISDRKDQKSKYVIEVQEINEQAARRMLVTRHRNMHLIDYLGRYEPNFLHMR